jgi:predicted phage terminase large subunit-like protein
VNQEQLDNLKRVALNNFYFFSLGILDYDYMVKEVHLPICNFLADDSIKDKMLLLPRGFLKTTLTSVALPIWLAMKDPNIRWLDVTNNMTNAANHLRKIKSQFERNEKLQMLFPERMPSFKKDRWTEFSATIPRDRVGLGEGTFDAAGIGTNLPSRHYDRINEDDIVTATKDDVSDREIAPSIEEINKAIGWHRLVPSLYDSPDVGYLYHTATRWCSYDPVDHIRKTEPYFKVYEQNVYKKINGELVDKGEPIYPSRFSQAALDKLMIRQGPYIFSTQYLLKPVPLELMIFKPDYIHYYDTLPNIRGVFYAYIDPASSASKTACHTAIIVIFCAENGKIYVVEVIRKVGMSLSESITHLFRIAKEYQTRLIGIEIVGYQEQLEREVRSMMTRTGNYFSVQGDRPRKGQSKAARIENLEPRFANGQIYIKHEHKGLESDLLEYQGIDKSKYVDTLDALAGAINISRFPFREADEPTMKTGVTLESILEELRGKFHKTFPIYGRHN